MNRKIIAKSLVIHSPDTGNLPCRFEVVETEFLYTVRMSGWDGKDWIPYIPCVWHDEKTIVNRVKAIQLMLDNVRDFLAGLVQCEYVFSMTKEPPQLK